MNKNESFDQKLEAELFSTFDINSEEAMELEASSSDNGTPCVTILISTVTGFIEC